MIDFYQIRSPLSQVTEERMARYIDALGQTLEEELRRVDLKQYLEDGFALLEKAGRKRGFLISGGEVDTERMSRILLDEFRGGKLGRFTLEQPPEANL